MSQFALTGNLGTANEYKSAEVSVDREHIGNICHLPFFKIIAPVFNVAFLTSPSYEANLGNLR